MVQRVRALLLLAAIGFCSGRARAQCSMDTECKGERVCEEGTCVEPATAPPKASVTPPVAPPAAVAELPPAAPAPLRRQSTGAFAGGLVMVAVGPVLVLVGAVLVSAAVDSCLSDYGNSYYATDPLGYRNCVDKRENTGYLVAGAGGVVIAVGVPLLIWGARKVPDTSAAQASLGPWLSPTHAGLQLRLEL